MALIEDVNNKKGQHVVKNDYWARIGVKVVRCHLPFGDYCLAPQVVVDTKRSIDELAQNIGSDHVRFKNACILARECKSRLVILTENDLGVRTLEDLESWTNPRAWANKKKGLKEPIDGKRLSKACKTMTERYGVEFTFCTPDETGQAVLDILEGGGKCPTSTT